MTEIKAPISSSSKCIRRYRKPSGEQVWIYAHNPYYNSAQNNSSTSSISDTNNNKTTRNGQKTNVCRHYLEGRCSRGGTCRFHHDVRHTVVIATPGSVPRPQPLSSLTGLPPTQQSFSSLIGLASTPLRQCESGGGSDRTTAYGPPLTGSIADSSYFSSRSGSDHMAPPVAIKVEMPSNQRVGRTFQPDYTIS